MWCCINDSYCNETAPQIVYIDITKSPKPPGLSILQCTVENWSYHYMVKFSNDKNNNFHRRTILGGIGNTLQMFLPLYEKDNEGLYFCEVVDMRNSIILVYQSVLYVTKSNLLQNNNSLTCNSMDIDNGISVECAIDRKRPIPELRLKYIHGCNISNIMSQFTRHDNGIKRYIRMNISNDVEMNNVILYCNAENYESNVALQPCVIGLFKKGGLFEKDMSSNNKKHPIPELRLKYISGSDKVDIISKFNSRQPGVNERFRATQTISDNVFLYCNNEDTYENGVAVQPCVVGLIESPMGVIVLEIVIKKLFVLFVFVFVLYRLYKLEYKKYKKM